MAYEVRQSIKNGLCVCVSACKKHILTKILQYDWVKLANLVMGKQFYCLYLAKFCLRR